MGLMYTQGEKSLQKAQANTESIKSETVILLTHT